MDNRTIEEIRENETKLINELKEEEKEIDRLNNLNKQLVEECQKLDDKETRLKNIIYTTLEYVDREEVSSVGTPFTSTSIGKEIKELLEGEKTFNSIWEENQRLNNIINELEKWVKEDVKEEKPDLYFQVLRKIDILDKLKELKEK